MLSALATGHKVGLAVVAGVFILFALASSFLLPRLRPDFPGRRLGLFVAVTVLLTAGMLTAVIALAGEPKEQRGETVAETAAPATTTAIPGATTETTTVTEAATGDPAAGKQLFAAEGCGSCHTFAPAGATGTVGPSLEQLSADAQKAGRGSVRQYAAESIREPDAYTVPGFPAGVMPQFGLTPKQIDDLVAFLTQPA